MQSIIQYIIYKCIQYNFSTMDEQEKNEIFRFRNFPVYKESRIFRFQLKTYSKKHFPKEEQYNLTSQLWRSLDSILLNIAEGTDRYSGKSNSNFLNIAIGSLDEVVGCIDAAYDDGYMAKEQQMIFLTNAEQIMRQLKALCSAIRKNKRSN